MAKWVKLYNPKETFEKIDFLHDIYVDVCYYDIHSEGDKSHTGAKSGI